jgi:enoyl-[acyl-carrier protein] reductase II
MVQHLFTPVSRIPNENKKEFITLFILTFMKPFNNRITTLFNINFPIIQAGMVWCSGWKLASAVSNAGGLGLIGAGSMHPETLQDHIRKCKSATQNPFGVNVPLLYPDIARIMKIIAEEQVEIVFTSAGNPALWTDFLKQRGIKVAHVVSSVKFARKAEQCGVDAIVAEGFEAGGHNGREETTTFVLTPMIRDAVSIPLLAAGGIATGRTMLAAEILGAEGSQIGSRFAVSCESSAHEKFKERITHLDEGETTVTLKLLTPVRLVKNKFYQNVLQAELRGASKEDLAEILGSRRSRLGIFEGDLEEGELEIGQVASTIRKIQPAKEILLEIWDEYCSLKNQLRNEHPQN